VSCNADVVDETASVLVDHVVNLQRNFQEFYRESVGVYELKVPLLRALSSASKEKEPSGPSVRPSFRPSLSVVRAHNTRSWRPFFYADERPRAYSQMLYPSEVHAQENDCCAPQLSALHPLIGQ
jgi:hypothetical protein